MTSTGSYDKLIKKTKANAVSNALKRSRMARASNSIWCSNPRPTADSMRSPPASTWHDVTVRRRAAPAPASVGPKTSSPKRKLKPEMCRQAPSGPTPPPHTPQPSTSRGYPLFATAGRQSAEFEASLEAFRDPEREPGYQGPFLTGDESYIPYNSDSSDYISPGSFCTRKGSKVHPPCRKRKDK